LKEVVSQKDWPASEIYLPDGGKVEVLGTEDLHLPARQQCQYNLLLETHED
jgi:hypothetical protein